MTFLAYFTCAGLAIAMLPLMFSLLSVPAKLRRDRAYRALLAEFVASHERLSKNLCEVEDILTNSHFAQVKLERDSMFVLSALGRLWNPPAKSFWPTRFLDARASLRRTPDMGAVLEYAVLLLPLISSKTHLHTEIQGTLKWVTDSAQIEESLNRLGRDVWNGAKFSDSAYRGVRDFVALTTYYSPEY